MHYTLADYVLDIVHNALEAGSRCTRVDIVEQPKLLSVTVADTGRGMGPEELRASTDPFYTDGRKHPSRKVGLGLPFLSQMVAQTGGSWSIDSAPGAGTRVEFAIDPSNIDVPPMGDIVGLFVSCISFDGEYEMEIVRTRGGFSGMSDLTYGVRRSEMIEALGELMTVSSRRLAREYIASLEGEDGKDDAR